MDKRLGIGSFIDPKKAKSIHISKERIQLSEKDAQIMSKYCYDLSSYVEEGEITRLPESVFVDPKKCTNTYIRKEFVRLPKKDAEFIANLTFYPYAKEEPIDENSKPKSFIKRLFCKKGR